MSNPFLIDGPAAISFSGGRTSAYMLWRILDVGLQPDVHIVFADTGKEREETYAFIREIEKRWVVNIVWTHRPGYFTQLITDKKFLPNPVMRFCTSELKIEPMRAFMLAQGYETWTNVVGFRRDEQGRVSRTRLRENESTEPWLSQFPLYEAGVTERDVTRFWKAQPFDLQLRKHEGNCDLCFLKGTSLRSGIIRDKPDLAAWWVEQEQRIGGRFRSDSPTYANLLNAPQFPEMSDDLSVMECFCHD
jgi:3'-phosphoadenosine 5'-phosphosulfate sulfotransferase (PAPS reductase)/FAD synthetase